MGRVRLSTRGGVVIPRAIRERHGWTAGTELELEVRADAIVLRRAPGAFAPTTVEQVRGCLVAPGPPVPPDRFDSGIENAVREDWSSSTGRQR